MIVRIAKNCRVVAEDGLSFTLQMREIIKDTPVGGKVSKQAGELSNWRIKGYYGTFGQALRGALKFTIINYPGHLSIDELIKNIQNADRHIATICEGIVSARSAAELKGEVEVEELDDLFSE